MKLYYTPIQISVSTSLAMRTNISNCDGWTHRDDRSNTFAIQVLVDWYSSGRGSSYYHITGIISAMCAGNEGVSTFSSLRKA